MSEPVTVELIGGYRDKKGALHKRVTIGKSITGQELFQIDSDPQSNNATQYEALILRAKITAFGELRMPVPLQALLELDSIDFDDLKDAANRFSEQARIVSAEDDTLRSYEFISESKLRLAFGYELNGLVYDMVEFGKRLTTMDEVAADNLGLQGIRRTCFLAGRQVVKLSQSEGASILPGPVELDVFAKLDLLDINALVAAAEVWRQSFRKFGARVQADGSGVGSKAGV
jgi:hypothetical protein